MQIDEAKRRFIHAWGNLGTNWGINRTMAQIHALLLITKHYAATEEIMEELKISRGNANMNLRALIDWGLIAKVCVPGDRKEYFVAEKDCWRAFRQIIEKRKKKELDPMLDVLNDISSVKGMCPESDEFCRMVKELTLFSHQANSALELLIKSDQNWMASPFLKMLR